jgi:hypothetical protein
MARHPDRKIYRIRRTLAPETDRSRSLPRALWGVSADAARRSLAQQREEFAAEGTATEELVAREQAEIARLLTEVEQQQKRLTNLRSIIGVLREKLANERAARSVLAARLMDRQAEQQKMVQAASASRMESVRLGADVSQEHEALRQLVAVLYRSIAGRAGIPADLAVLKEIPLEPSKPVPKPNLFRTGPADTGPRWYRFLLGKKAGRRLTAPDGQVVVEEGETIGAENIAAAEAADLLTELLVTAKVVERIPDL